MDVFCQSSGRTENKKQQSRARSIRAQFCCISAFPDFHKRWSRVGWGRGELGWGEGGGTVVAAVAGVGGVGGEGVWSRCCGSACEAISKLISGRRKFNGLLTVFTSRSI